MPYIQARRGANDVWVKISSLVQKRAIRAEDFMQLQEKLTGELHKQDSDCIAVAMRSIQIRRIEFIFEGKLASPRKIIQSLAELQADYKQAQICGKNKQVSRIGTSVK